jgi:hypothetical protein
LGRACSNTRGDFLDQLRVVLTGQGYDEPSDHRNKKRFRLVSQAGAYPLAEVGHIAILIIQQIVPWRGTRVVFGMICVMEAHTLYASCQLSYCRSSITIHSTIAAGLLSFVRALCRTIGLPVQPVVENFNGVWSLERISPTPCNTRSVSCADERAITGSKSVKVALGVRMNHVLLCIPHCITSRESTRVLVAEFQQLPQ